MSDLKLPPRKTSTVKAEDIAVLTDVRAGADDSMHQALQVYRDTLREKLELEHMNQYLRLDPSTGDYVVAHTRGEARGVFRARFGDAIAWTIHIGST